MNDTELKEYIYTQWVVNRKSQREIAKMLNIDLGKLEWMISRLGLVGARDKVKYTVKEELFDFRIPQFCYLAGIILTDGHINLKERRIHISMDDGEHLEAISRFFSKDVVIPIYTYQRRNGKVSHVLRITSEKLVKVLEENGICGKNKTSGTACPDVITLECFRMLLRGIIDGDGCLRIHGSKMVMVMYSHSVEFVRTFQEQLLKHYNYIPTVSPRKGKTGKEISTRADFTFELVDIYKNYPEFAIKRKKEKVQQLVNDIVHSYEMINRKV